MQWGMRHARSVPGRSRRRVGAMTSAVLAAGLALLALGAQPSAAGDGAEHSDNLELVGSLELHGAMSLQFSSRRPHAYVHSREGGGMVTVLDISDPLAPRARGRLPVPSGPYMEDMQLGERPGTAFVLVRMDNELVVVDVSDPDAPRRRGAVAAPSHTYECADRACTYAYATWTASDNLRFAVVDLRDLGRPAVVAELPSPVGMIHDWHRDGAGTMWAVGMNGIAAYDASAPAQPRLLNSSDAHGLKSPTNPYNDRLQFHGAQRPHAAAFDGLAARPSLASGNVLLVSEEGDNADCTDSFQTWFVPSLSGRDVGVPQGSLGLGTVTPISQWSLLSADPTTVAPDPAFCSLHWFDYHEAGFVALPAYASGTRILDVRDPAAIRQVAFHYDDDTLAVQSYWVPERHGNGRTTGRPTNVVYTMDAGLIANPFLLEAHPSGRLDVFRVDPAVLSGA